MILVRLSVLAVLAISLATGACVKQGTVASEPAMPAPATTAPAAATTPATIDLFQLCSDPHFAAACTPVAPTPRVHPLRVDTNLAEPHHAPFAG
jgi:hypothetical protein